MTAIDEEARRKAVMEHGSTFLVEAGAGTGKTSVMAGRIAMMLAAGRQPESIVAITFTEMAAGELLGRIRKYTEMIAAGTAPAELREMLPNGLSAPQQRAAADSLREIDRMTCTTIHGFCNRIIRLYPVKADIDPGSATMEEMQTARELDDTVEQWFRKRLSVQDSDTAVLEELVLADSGTAIEYMKAIVENSRRRGGLAVAAGGGCDEAMGGFGRAVEEFAQYDGFLGEGGQALVDEFKRISNVVGEFGGGIGLVRLLTADLDDVVFTKTGSPRSFRKKGAWQKGAGDREAGEAAFDAFTELYDSCHKAFAALKEAVLAACTADLAAKAAEIIEDYQRRKRESAFLDFDDLVATARDMLRNHADVRRQLADRFRHIFIDEFQDTDPVQNEIFWRLCGDPVDEDWRNNRIRPGSLFLVGDPKQAIYRFRGADIDAYMTAKANLRRHEPESILEITRNFRSDPGILDYVNDKFTERLGEDRGQPGFIELVAGRQLDKREVFVAALDIQDGTNTSNKMRDAEAEAVAQACNDLIGTFKIYDKSGDGRPCEPGDIALLAPTGSSLWIYENKLEQYGIPITTRAGKSFFRRQEVQDMIAVARVLADGRDTTALGAILRGPLVGLTEEALLDLVAAMPEQQFPTLATDPATVPNPLAADIIGRLRALHERRNQVTPYALLLDAVESLRVRPLLRQRFTKVDRSIANLDMFLDYARNFDVFGIHAFAEAMTSRWADGDRVVEGCPDTGKDAVSIHTIHSAKGLEWPIVIPINTATAVTPAGRAGIIVDDGGMLHCRLFGHKTAAFEKACEQEDAERRKENERLFYVAMTRAKEMLLLPRRAENRKRSWAEMIELYDTGIDGYAMAGDGGRYQVPPEPDVNEQDAAQFAAERAQVEAAQAAVIRRTPSGLETEDGAEDKNRYEIRTMDARMQVGRIKGSILHKIMEELILGTVALDEASIRTQLDLYIRQNAHELPADGTDLLDIDDLVNCVVRTLALPEIDSMFTEMVAEFPVYGREEADGRTVLLSGVADAVVMAAGQPDVIVDWKSDKQIVKEALAKYEAQVGKYMELTGAGRGLIVFMATGETRRIGAWEAAE